MRTEVFDAGETQIVVDPGPCFRPADPAAETRCGSALKIGGDTLQEKALGLLPDQYDPPVGRAEFASVKQHATQARGPCSNQRFEHGRGKPRLAGHDPERSAFGQVKVEILEAPVPTLAIGQVEGEAGGFELGQADFLAAAAGGLSAAWSEVILGRICRTATTDRRLALPAP